MENRIKQKPSDARELREYYVLVAGPVAVWCRTVVVREHQRGRETKASLFQSVLLINNSPFFSVFLIN